MKMLSITADTNDADYITEITENIDRKTEELVLKVCDVIKNHPSGQNWFTIDYMSSDTNPYNLYSKYLTEEEINAFSDLCPYGDNGIHTIINVDIYTIADKLSLI